jgi:hypothetical protein
MKKNSVRVGSLCLGSVSFFSRDVLEFALSVCAFVIMLLTVQSPCRRTSVRNKNENLLHLIATKKLKHKNDLQRCAQLANCGILLQHVI